jgi:hypothetical protein
MVIATDVTTGKKRQVTITSGMCNFPSCFREGQVLEHEGEVKYIPPFTFVDGTPVDDTGYLFIIDHMIGDRENDHEGFSKKGIAYGVYHVVHYEDGYEGKGVECSYIKPSALGGSSNVINYIRGSIATHLYALETMPDGWRGYVVTDSRFATHYLCEHPEKIERISKPLYEAYCYHADRLDWDGIDFMHPTHGGDREARDFQQCYNDLYDAMYRYMRVMWKQTVVGRDPHHDEKRLFANHNIKRNYLREDEPDHATVKFQYPDDRDKRYGRRVRKQPS